MRRQRTWNCIQWTYRGEQSAPFPTPTLPGEAATSAARSCSSVQKKESYITQICTHTLSRLLCLKSCPYGPLRPSPKRSHNTKVTSAVDSGFSPDTPAKRGVSKDFFSRVNYGFLPSADKQRHCRTIHVKHQCIVATCISLLLGPAV